MLKYITLIIIIITFSAFIISCKSATAVDDKSGDNDENPMITFTVERTNGGAVAGNQPPTQAPLVTGQTVSTAAPIVAGTRATTTTSSEASEDPTMPEGWDMFTSPYVDSSSQETSLTDGVMSNDGESGDEQLTVDN